MERGDRALAAFDTGDLRSNNFHLKCLRRRRKGHSIGVRIELVTIFRACEELGSLVDGMREDAAASGDGWDQEWFELTDAETPQIMMEQNAVEDWQRQVGALHPRKIARAPALKVRPPGKSGVGFHHQARL